MNDDTIEYKDLGLKKLVQIFNGRMPTARVGILGNTTGRDGQLTNAQVGAFHEFGTSKLPIRSFLRVPILENFRRFLYKSNQFTPGKLKEVVAAGSARKWVEIIGVIAEDVVAEAFATGGFGKWKPSNMKFKKNHQTLVETQQLRDSITSDVKD